MTTPCMSHSRGAGDRSAFPFTPVKGIPFLPLVILQTRPLLSSGALLTLKTYSILYDASRR